MTENELHVGDLILFRIQGRAFQHTAIVVEPGYVVHADTDFVKKEPIGNTSKFVPPVQDGVPSAGYLLPYVYRCVSNAALATRAANYAQRFGRNSIGAKGATMYGAGRASGVNFQLSGDKNPPFEFDAICRAFKWAAGGGKGGDQFSAKKGTTCAAFVIACYQAAAVSLIARGDESRIKACLDLLREWRVDKKPTEKARWQKKWVKSESHGGQLREVSDGYLRKVSNVGVRPTVGWAADQADPEVAEGAWALLVETLTEGEGEVFSPEVYMTRPMTVDAKFCFSQTLHERLEDMKDEDWVKQGRLEY